MLALALDARAGAISRAEDAAAKGVVVNTGIEPVQLDLVELTSAPLALEIVDEAGNPLPMLPPPTPGRPDMIVLAPGERHTIQFHSFLPPGTPRGRYRVRLRYDFARSEWIDLVVA